MQRIGRETTNHGMSGFTVLNTYRYAAFGNELDPDMGAASNTSTNNNGNNTNPNTNPFRYAGEYLDWETATYYLRARHFNPRTGRFTQPDPHWHRGNMIFGDSHVTLNGRLAPNRFAIMQAGNLYAYTINNPVMFSDPSGRIIKKIIAGIGWGVKSLAGKGGTITAAGGTVATAGGAMMTGGPTMMTGGPAISSAAISGKAVVNAAANLVTIAAISWSIGQNCMGGGSPSMASTPQSGAIQGTETSPFGVGTTLLQAILGIQSVGTTPVVSTFVPQVTGGSGVSGAESIGDVHLGSSSFAMGIGGGSSPGDPNDPHNRNNNREDNSGRVFSQASRSSKEVNRYLQNNGFEFVRQKGSHATFSNGTTSVTVPQGYKDIPFGTLQRILKDAALW